MATYIFKRKTYGSVTEGAKQTGAGMLGGVGNALDSTPAAIGGGLLGGHYLGNAIGGALANTGFLGNAIGGPLGWLIGAGIGAAATKGLGKGLKKASGYEDD